MRTRIYITIVLLLTAFAARAQVASYNPKKTLKEVRANIKAEKYAQADDQISKAMKADSAARFDTELNYLMMGVQHGLAAAENRKIFLANKPDTAKYFSYIYKVYQYAISTDSLDRLPDEKGRVRPRHTTGVSSQLMSYRNNIKSGGKFFYMKKKYDDSFRFFDIYLQTQHHPALVGLKHFEPDADSLEIMRMAVYSAYNASQFKNVMKYLPQCMSYDTDYTTLCQIGSRTLMTLSDTIGALSYLDKGWKSDPMQEYFYITLLDYYTGRHDYTEAYSIVTEQLKVMPQNRLLWYVKGKCEQGLDSIDAAIESYKQAIKIQENDAQSYASLGGIYISQGRRAYEENHFSVGTAAYTKAKQEQDKLFDKARENFELARKYNPEDTSMWLDSLKEIYFRLNKGDELKALESLK